MNKKPELARMMYNKKTIAKWDKKITLLGIYNKLDTITFLNLRLFTSIIVFFVVLYVIDLGYVIAPLVTFLYYYFIGKVLIDNKIKARTSKLEGEAMHFFEVLTLSLETGRNLEEAINVTISNIDSELSDEFAEALREVKFGKSIIDTMYNQVDYLREKKKLEIKAEISKVPIKISIISVLFFVPLILLIILAPVLLSYIS